MAGTSWLTKAKQIGVFLLGRYPMIMSVMLMVILGERAEADNNVPPFNVSFLYGYIVLMALTGVGMSYDLKRMSSALVFVAHLALLAHNLYTNEQLGYKPWLKNRLILRCVGLSGVYVIYAFLTSREKNKTIQKVGEGLLAIYTMTYMFVLVNSEEDRGLFVDRIPLKTSSLFFLISVMGACAMIYINGGLFVTDASQAMMCINLALLLVINGDIGHWVYKRGTPFWVQVKMILDDLFICIGLFVMAFAKIYWKNRLPKEDEAGNLYHHD